MPRSFNFLSVRHTLLMAGCALMILQVAPAEAHGDEEAAAAAAAGQLHKSRLVLEPGSMAAYMMSPAYAIYSKALNECYNDVQTHRMGLPQDQTTQDLEGEPLPIGADGKRIFRVDEGVKTCMDTKGVPYTYPEYMKDRPGKIDPTRIDPAVKADLDTITRMLESGQAPATTTKDVPAISAAPVPVIAGDTESSPAQAAPPSGEESDKPKPGERKRKSNTFYVTPE